jgi:hypothetical protein
MLMHTALLASRVPRFGWWLMRFPTVFLPSCVPALLQGVGSSSRHVSVCDPVVFVNHRPRHGSSGTLPQPPLSSRPHQRRGRRAPTSRDVGHGPYRLARLRVVYVAPLTRPKCSHTVRGVLPIAP